ncbi:MAG TPA: hypothetical protein IAB35_04845 [Candidatus Faecimonas gallistercoris]|nr:hypothetical protein [Candidatus Faecimonas gallistercoris]
MSSIDVINNDISNCIDNIKSNLNIANTRQENTSFDYVADFRNYYNTNIEKMNTPRSKLRGIFPKRCYFCC